MYTSRNISKGEELLTQYGYKASYTFYMYYGFILDDEFGANLNQNFVPLLVELGKSDPLYDEKLKILTLNK